MTQHYKHLIRFLIART